MSPRRIQPESSANVRAASERLTVGAGVAIRDARIRKRWTLRRLADAAGLSVSRTQSVEAGIPASAETYARLASALGLRAELTFADPRRRDTTARTEDPVHAAMAEVEARHFRPLGRGVAIDEPYQHYQFAGRADLLAWDLPSRALLHIENRTLFPNVQEFAGSFNAKRVYLAKVIADRLAVAGGFRSVTHAVVALWSAEVIHALRLRTETFRTLCPDPPHAFEAWWNGTPPTPGTYRTLVLFDPTADLRRRDPFRGLDPIATLRPRYADYREAVARLDLEDRERRRH